MDLQATFGTDAPLVGMAHLPPLPGAPGFDGDREAIVERAAGDARRIAGGGFDGVLLENYGDVPFHPEDVPKHVVATMTAVAATVRREVGLPLGINVLRNDAEAAVSVAQATGGAFVRVNVHAGVRATDQGLVSGRAHETMRLIDRLEAPVSVLADVAVKHSAPIGGEDLETAVDDLVNRALADGVIVSGSGTGAEVDREGLETVREVLDRVAPDVPLFVGSGVTTETVGQLLEVADGAIVGTAIKESGVTTNRVDEARVAGLVEAHGGR